MTQRLYHEDGSCRTFTARVISAVAGPDHTTDLVLDRTAFYPTGGGQPHDLGTLNEVPVLEVIEDGEQVVHRVLGSLSARDVTGVIDWSRRLDHRQQHTGQHILSAAFVECAKAPTTAFHLGEVTCTIDLACEELSDATLQRVLDRANAVILEDRPLQVAWFDRPEDLPSTVRKEAPAVGRIRLVSVEHFDASPCCGTHCERTGQVGPIHILGTERRKGGTRVEFLCGGRALRDHAFRHRTLKEAARVLSTDASEVPARVDALLADLKSLQKRVKQLDAALLPHVEQELLSTPDALRTVVDLGADRRAWFPRLGPTLARAARHPVLLASVEGEHLAISIAVADAARHSAAALLNTVLEPVAGRGGGSPQMAQGKCGAHHLDAVRTRWTALNVGQGGDQG